MMRKTLIIIIRIKQNLLINLYNKFIFYKMEKIIVQSMRYWMVGNNNNKVCMNTVVHVSYVMGFLPQHFKNSFNVRGATILTCQRPFKYKYNNHGE